MTRSKSSSLVEDRSMDGATSTASKKHDKECLNGEPKGGGGGNNGADEEECDVEAWNTLSRGFKQAQTVLHQNRELIRLVNENHQSKIPDNLAKNVSLIHEINDNISKVMSIYSDLSVNFSNIVHEKRRSKNDSNVESNTPTTDS